jgi:hypothetical protein
MSVKEVGREIHDVLRRLVELPIDSFAFIEVVGTRNRYVQFASDGEGGLLGEVVSNQFFDGDELLSDEIEDRMITLGWRPPEALYRRGDERVNYYREWLPPADLKRAACLAAVTLRDAFAVTGPDGISVEVEVHEPHGEDD